VLGAQGGGELLQDDLDGVLIEEVDQWVEIGGFYAQFSEFGGDLPGLVKAVALDPAGDGVFASGDFTWS
jgi:hypothetical protein